MWWIMIFNSNASNVLFIWDMPSSNSMMLVEHCCAVATDYKITGKTFLEIQNRFSMWDKLENMFEVHKKTFLDRIY